MAVKSFITLATGRIKTTQLTGDFKRGGHEVQT
jgi:hypothetical protein